MLQGTWQGFEVASAALEQLVNDLARDEVLAGALVVACKPTVVNMRQATRRRPPAPDMADSLAVGYSEDESGPGEVVVKIGPRRRHPHGFLIRLYELGSSRTPADGTMRATYEADRAAITPRFIQAITPAFAKALQRAIAFARAQGSRRTAFQRMKRATTKGEFLAALKEWAPGAGA